MEGEDTDTDNPRSFQKAAWWKRLIILVAGSGMNFIIGLLIMLIVFMPAKNFITPEISYFEEGCSLHSENGLQLGDRFVSIDGEKIYVQSDVGMILSLKGGDVHDVVVERNGKLVTLDDFQMPKQIFGDEEVPRYGFSFSYEKATFANKLKYTWNSSINVVRSVRLSLQMLLTGKAGLSDVAGPVGIMQQMSDLADASPTWVDALLNMLYFGGFIAINLAVMNLLPIPALDGGRVVALLLTTAIEAVIHKKIDPKYEGYIHGVGMIILFGLMALIMFKDIFVIFRG